jgi:multisubunit Na+/H+ antiporter MnhB subunit
MSGFVDIGLALLLIALALWTVFVPTAFAAIAGFVAYGLLLGLVWVRLSGIDVALTEAAIGGGLTGALLLGAYARLRDTEATARADACSGRTRALALLLSVAVSAALVVCVFALPQPAPSLAAEVAADIAATGVGNPITAVLLAFRAMDTLLEAVVLVIALLGVWSLSRDADWGGRPGLRQKVDPNGILTYFARVLVPIGFVIAIYIFWAGADHPGGKFQAATLLAAMWMLMLMAGLVDMPPISRRALRVLVVLGPLVFIALGFAGVALAGAFLGYPEGLAKPMIIVIEVALLPSLAVILALLLAGPARRGSPP